MGECIYPLMHVCCRDRYSKIKPKVLPGRGRRTSSAPTVPMGSLTTQAPTQRVLRGYFCIRKEVGSID